MGISHQSGLAVSVTNYKLRITSYKLHVDRDVNAQKSI